MKEHRTETIGHTGKELSGGLAVIWQEWESKSLAIKKPTPEQRKEFNLLQHSQRTFMVFYLFHYIFFEELYHYLETVDHEECLFLIKQHSCLW